MAGRIAAGILVTYCLLLPISLSAHDFEDAGSQAGPVTREYGLVKKHMERLDQRLEELLEELEAAKTAHEDATRSIIREQERLEQRVEELEIAKIAQEDATRSIIRQTLSGLGSRINEFVIFGGTVEVLTGWSEDFQGQSERVIQLSTAQLDFEIQVNPWTLGSIIVEFDDGADTLFPTTTGTEESVEKINLDTAFLTIGDTQRFWPFATLGRMIVPFGISTGDPVADVLTLVDPLTVEVFETKEDAILIGVEFPTPPLTPLTPTVSPPPVRPLVVNPLFTKLSRLLGYRPFPTPPPPPTFTTPTPTPPPFSAGVYLYNGDTHDQGSRRDWRPSEHIGATLGYRTKVNCRPYHGQQRKADEPGLNWLHFFCPGSIDVDVDFNNSVFDSEFLESKYQEFLGQIGFVPGMAASVKANLGPVGLVGEWNGAINDATFTDDLGRRVNIRPSAWQVSLGYQFDWNPSVTAIGAQGTYFAIGYSESQDLAGVTEVIGEGTSREENRVGFVPKKRFLVDVGEWVLDGLRIAVEYSRIWDYSKSKGGTGRSANGGFSQLTYEW